MADLGRRSRSGFISDAFGNLLRQIITFIVSVVLARLLVPEEFGLIGISLAFITVVQVFIDVGFTEGVIQRREVSNVAYSSIFFLNLTVSIFLAILLFFLAPQIANYYQKQELVDVLQGLSLVLPIGACGRVHGALLLKNLHFYKLVTRDIISAFIGGMVGILAAYNGAGVMSLVWQQITSVLFSTILMWTAVHWKPQFQFSLKEVKPIFTFSGYVFFDQIIRQIFLAFETLFVGKVFSPTTLGFYSRAESINAQVMTYTSSSLQKFTLPIFSTIQNDHRRFEFLYLKVFSLIAVVSVFIAGILAIIADPLIKALFGDKWLLTIPIFQILAIRTITSPFGALMGRAMLSQGLSKLKLKMSMFERVLRILPFFIGYYFGINMFAWSVVLFSFIIIVVQATFFQVYLKISLKAQLKAFFQPLVPLILFLIIVFYGLFDNYLMLGLAFVFTEIFFLFFIKNEGYYFLLDEVKLFIKKVL